MLDAIALLSGVGYFVAIAFQDGELTLVCGVTFGVVALIGICTTPW